MTEAAMPTNVIEALARVTAEMPAIQKAHTMTQGANYKFRSIEQMTGHASTLFGRYGIVIVPIARDITYVDIVTQRGGTMTEAQSRYEWAIYGPGGTDDVILASSFGQARDSGDKSANKAHTAAYKYLLMTLLCISDDKEDPDFERAEHQDQEYEEEDVAVTERFNQLMTEAVDGKEKYGDLWAQVLREQAETEGHQSVNAWFRADPDAAEIFVTSHKLKAEMTLRQNQEPVEHGGIPDDAPTPPKRTRAKAGSAVKPPEEDHAAAARRVVEAFPDSEFVDDEPELDLS